jgi:hypothetical protein
MSGMIVVDFQEDASLLAAYAKPLLLEVLSSSGALISDFESWTSNVKGHEVSLAGKLSTSGLRRLLSIVDSPISGDIGGKAQGTSPGDLATAQVKRSLDYFHSIVGMADDLKEDMKNVKNLASTQLFFDKYAKRIERMPILGVDPELLKYSAFVANTLRQCTGSIKTMGIQTGVRQLTETGGGGGGGYTGGYQAGGIGVSYFDPYSGLKAVEADRRVIRAEEKATAATDIQGLRQQLISATFEMRRKMTEKYQVEF